ncbi:YbjN domain-containing protein [Parvularcula marina]|uniref:YbjN domain-containing protein n=1 Tax=Parvularcula marina TaxID=2292771 RepID=UPI0035157641
MKSFAILVSAAAGLLGAAFAQPVTDPTGVVPNLSFENIEPVIRSFDESITMVNQNGVRLIRIESRGRVVLLQENGCTRGGCAGLMIFAGFDETTDLETINQYNATTPSQRALLDQDGRVVLLHYVIGDFGVTRGSLIVNIGAFFAGIDKWQEEFSRGVLVKSVKFDPLLDENAVAESHISREVLDLLWEDPSLYNQAKTQEAR